MSLKALLGSLLTIALAVGGWWVIFKADKLFGAAMTSDWPTAQTTSYKIDAYGFDLRAYEYVTPGGQVCNVAFTEHGPIGLDCQPAPTAEVSGATQ